MVGPFHMAKADTGRAWRESCSLHEQKLAKKMSDIALCLVWLSKGTYLDKLKLLGLEEGGSPYFELNVETFVDDTTLWPHVEYGHIFCYFVDRPGVYTKEQLLQWKSLNTICRERWCDSHCPLHMHGWVCSSSYSIVIILLRQFRRRVVTCGCHALKSRICYMKWVHFMDIKR